MKGVNNWGLHICHALIVKLLDEIIQLNGANCPQILTKPFCGFIHLFHVPQ